MHPWAELAALCLVVVLLILIYRKVSIMAANTDALLASQNAATAAVTKLADTDVPALLTALQDAGAGDAAAIADATTAFDALTAKAGDTSTAIGNALNPPAPGG